MPTPIPRLGGLPLIGNLLEFRRDRVALLDRVRRECGDVGAMRLGRSVIVISSPELARVVLVEQADAFEKGPVVRRFARPILGDGLIAAENAAHRPRRRMLNPAFTPKEIARYAGAFVARTHAMIDGWREGEERDLARDMTRLTLEIVGDTLFSADLSGDAAALGEALTTVMRHVTGMIERPLRLPIAVPTPWNREVRAAIARLDATIATLVQARRRALEAGEAPRDLVGAMVAARDPEGERVGGLTDRQIRDEAMNMLLAGHETSASALAWARYLLGRHPAIDAALRDEARAALGDRRAGYDDVARLPLAQAVVRETLRLYPAVHSLGRQASRDVALGPHALTRGDVLIVSPWLMHRRADLFPDPERFDPGRFLDGRDAAIPRYAYLPFGAGPRTCMGNAFAHVEATLVLATLAQRVELAAVGGVVEAEMLVTLRPRGGVRARVIEKRG